VHIPVLLKEVITYLDPQPGKIYIDATLGEGGHAREILKISAPSGKLIGIDQDEESLKIAKKNLSSFKERVIYTHDNFRNLKRILQELRIRKVNGILLDLGVSSYQLMDPNRGFSFKQKAFLDMRMDKNQKLTAYEIINHYPKEELVKIIRELGEEPYVKKIVENIIEARRKKPIRYTDELVEIIDKSIPLSTQRRRKIHFATSTFRALRMAVNDELGALESCLKQIPGVILGGGRIVIITFHSLEDRLVKKFLQQESKDCLCPAEQPLCTCKHKATLKILTKKPLIPSQEEINLNPRARSAKLRAAEKLANN